MLPKPHLPKILTEISVNDLIRIDAALEGKWDTTVATIWSRQRGCKGFEKVSRRHATFKPSIELYFKDGWVGIHCFNRVGDTYVFDEQLARDVIDYVENALNR